MAAKKAVEGEKQEDGKYKHTVDLPKTTFGLIANSVQREPELQKLWDDNQVLKRVSERNTGAAFVLHDEPPYANGDLHMGHALNKILKDFINRYKLLQNHKVSFVPGWDCHGLPIELKSKFICTKESTLLTLQIWAASVDIHMFEILLCIGNKADLVPGHSVQNIEYIEACASNADFDNCRSVDGDSQGLERLFGALSAHMWPRMILKYGNRITAPFLVEKQGN
ncbi:Isoleucine--tRNA ligase, chloroplastic/mitochondrial [Zea mays]|uniref:Isoleucine--tRNA ligase, chloroplastic/mitochondrial n=1 Tax=Zea mays TaxID=4577 RepID=A0A3L6EVX4_MAIZE|nr:Isoleucine--tRNA ligase, chloroplastic/mitochondrial [Zea mays]